jgi:hypothetical protein
MPTIIDYRTVLERLEQAGMVCNYHGSGAFGYPEHVSTQVLAWVGPIDVTIRPEFRERARLVEEPFAENLARLVDRAWREALAGVVWLMPASHWAYELTFGGGTWLVQLLGDVGVDPTTLAGRPDASAVEFAPVEGEAFYRIVEGLIRQMGESDFVAVWPDAGVLAHLHHHKQVWWVAPDNDAGRRVIGRLQQF